MLFLIYVNDLPKTVNDKTVPILFADDASIRVKSLNSKDFQTNKVTAFNCVIKWFNPYPTAFPYGNGMVLHFYQQQESSTTKTVHKVINKGLKAYV